MSLEEIINDLHTMFEDLPQGLQDAILQIALLLLAFLLIWILRRVLTYAIIRPLRRIVKRTGHDRDDEILDAVMLPIRYFVIAAALLVSISILDTGEAVNTFTSNLARSIIIIGLMLLLYRLVDIFAPTSNRLFAITGLSIEERLLPFIRTGIKLLALAVTVVIILQDWGYDVTGLIAGLGLGGLAISLAAQDTVSNLFGFTAIVGDRPFDVGDYIIMPEAQGLVEHVGIRSTRIRQLDQALVYVPNSKLASSAITNWSRLSKRRVNYLLGVTYDATSEDMRLLLHRIREMLNDWASVEPGSVVVYFMEFGDSALNILVRCYVNIPDWGEFHAEQEQIHLAIMDVLKDLGMSVAFPSRSLYLENLPDLARDMEAMSFARRQEGHTLSPRERALLDEVARAEREAAPPPPPLSPSESREPGLDADVPGDDEAD